MLLIDLVKNGLYIIEGYGVWVWNVVTGKTRALAMKRLEICNACPHNKKGVCDICGCILKAKARVDYPLDGNGISIDGCPLEKW